MPLSDYLKAITDNTQVLRRELKSSTGRIIDVLPGMGSTVNGSIYVESIGATVCFHNGVMENFYTPHGILSRDRLISRWNESRKELFSHIARQFPSGSRIINIGAGGDVTPIKIMQEHKHEIISTDFAEDSIELLRSRISAPAFAGDLLYINRLVPEPVHFVIGNSTLAYITPAKLAEVVKNIYGIMNLGGVFTFDMMPHESYFNIIHQREAQTLINECEANPLKLSEYISKYGIQDGINAMAYFVFYQGYSANLAMIDCIKRLFEELGARCTTGIVQSKTENGNTSWFTLRVAKADYSILEKVDREILYTSTSQQFLESLSGSSPSYEIGYIDRKSAIELADKLAIKCNEKAAPWLVARFVKDNQDSKKLPQSVRNAVLKEIDPVMFAETIMPYILRKKTYIPPKALDLDVAYDQFMHYQVLSGSQRISTEQADKEIDLKYEQARIRFQKKAERISLERVKQTKRDDRKRQKEARKKQRRR